MGFRGEDGLLRQTMWMGSWHSKRWERLPIGDVHQKNGLQFGKRECGELLANKEMNSVNSKAETSLNSFVLDLENRLTEFGRARAFLPCRRCQTTVSSLRSCVWI